MDIEGCTALVTGSNRGLGKAYVQALLDAGAAKVYAGMRDLSSYAEDDGRVQPIRIDVTNTVEVAEAASRCGDIDLLINNAGIMLAAPMLAADSEQALRRELEVNLFGPLHITHAFAPVLARNGGGAIVNMLSVVSWYVYPFNSTYCATKFAAEAMTDALRIELKAQHTQVVGVYAGFIDTDMAGNVAEGKTPPAQVAQRTLDGLRSGEIHVLADQAAVDLRDATRSDPFGVAQWAQHLWDEGCAWSV